MRICLCMSYPDLYPFFTKIKQKNLIYIGWPPLVQRTLIYLALKNCIINQDHEGGLLDDDQLEEQAEEERGEGGEEEDEQEREEADEEGGAAEERVEGGVGRGRQGGENQVPHGNDSSRLRYLLQNTQDEGW